MSKPSQGGAPTYRSRCCYCGDLEPAAHESCCGEKHYSEEPECPHCSADVTPESGTSGSNLEFTIWRCEQCGWQSDPE